MNACPHLFSRVKHYASVAGMSGIHPSMHLKLPVNLNHVDSEFVWAYLSLSIASIRVYMCYPLDIYLSPNLNCSKIQGFYVIPCRARRSQGEH